MACSPLLTCTPSVASLPCSLSPHGATSSASVPASLHSSQLPLVRHRVGPRDLRRCADGGRRRRCHPTSAKFGDRSSSSSSSSDDTSKAILDAFFLGRALADTVNERLGSALGELISDISRRQAEQRDQVRQFQEEVQERATAAQAKAAREAARSRDPRTPSSARFGASASSASPSSPPEYSPPPTPAPPTVPPEGL
eukprot:TRINITY_DN35542_c0_g1_i1.p1 TRINITY_DN35542_c0_g1~~TRINITY_DN35542_c0_g1_i1.p1  ORF type:complete len:213 (-),score=36.07 TRINITY_DN35542_c0_g1_i1:581-1171(-)